MSIRVAVGDPRQITVTFPAAATGFVTVSIDSARTGATTGPFTATLVSGSTYGYTLAAGDVAAADDLKLTFSGTVAGVARTLTEYVQVAGGHYFTVAEARSLGPVPASFTDDQIEQQRTAVEDQIEANLNTSMVARLVVEKVNGNGEGFIRLTEPYILGIVKVLADGVDVTADVELDGRYVWAPTASWAYGHRNIEVRYEAGYETHPPEDLRRKAIEATRHELLRGNRQGAPAAVLSITTEGYTQRMAIAGLRQPFGLPEVDSVVLKWAKRVGVEL